MSTWVMGDSDHNLIHLDTTYRLMLEQQGASTRTVKVWSKDAEEALQYWGTLKRTSETTLSVSLAA